MEPKKTLALRERVHNNRGLNHDAASTVPGDSIRTNGEMPQATNLPLICAGAVMLVGAILHVAIIFGGPGWYRFFGAPDRLVQMAAEGHWYPVVACLVIATLLLACTAFAFAGAGLIRPLPMNRIALCLIAAILIFRGLVFIPMAVWRPDLLGAITSSRGVDTFLVVTSALCLLTGLGYAFGVQRAWNWLGSQGSW
jgi:putative oxidoreductase